MVILYFLMELAKLASQLICLKALQSHAEPTFSAQQLILMACQAKEKSWSTKNIHAL